MHISCSPKKHFFGSVCFIATTVVFSLLISCKERGTGPANLKDDTEVVDPAFRGVSSYPIYAYDQGPNPLDPDGKALIDLNSKIPYFPGLSKAIYGDQMFRPAFGPMPWRMMQAKNKVQILFIGQDGTHIAEAAGRPATAGFGGRAQDLAAHFGVSAGAAFINTYAFTIRWQYGAFDTPFIKTGANGVKEFGVGSFTGNPVWLLTQDQQSPITKWRNDLISWIIRNNKDSLKLIVLFGGAARDAAGAFVESKGGTVGTRLSADKIRDMQIQIPEFDLKGAGSNKQTSVPFNKSGGDLYLQFKGVRSLDYTKPEVVTQIQKEFAAAFKQDPARWTAEMVLPKGGLHGSGMIHPAQMGGYDIARKMKIGDSEVGTISLKGLRIAPDVVVDRDILITQLPHPTALSMMTPDKASESVGAGLANFKKYVEAGWKVDAEPGFVNTFATGQPCPTDTSAGFRPGCYKYRRGDMGTEYYDFGSPNSRMVNVSTAVRSGANVIVFGSREKTSFTGRTMVSALKKMSFGTPSSWPNPLPENINPPNPPFADEMWISRASSPSENRQYDFDPGPGKEMAKLMKTTLPRDPAFLEKMKVNGDFGHYRGTFTDPKVVIIADPDGDDDLITSRALTGTRGQYLHSLMTGMGVGSKYLLIKTAPYSNYDEASWNEIITKTKAYRKAVLTKVFASTTPKLIITDGEWAKKELQEIFPTCPIAGVDAGSCPIVHISRQGISNNSGIEDSIAKIRLVADFSAASFSGKMTDIPRSHLTYYARTWEGTSGDRVITSDMPAWKGKVFAEVAPNWAFRQKFKINADDLAGCEALMTKMLDGKVRLGSEKVADFLTRTGAPNRIVARDHCLKTASSEAGTGGGADGAGARIGGQSVEDEQREIDGLPSEPVSDDEHTYFFK